jgi:hypothetical protein
MNPRKVRRWFKAALKWVTAGGFWFDWMEPFGLTLSPRHVNPGDRAGTRAAVDGRTRLLDATFLRVDT